MIEFEEGFPFCSILEKNGRCAWEESIARTTQIPVRSRFFVLYFPIVQSKSRGIFRQSRRFTKFAVKLYSRIIHAGELPLVETGRKGDIIDIYLFFQIFASSKKIRVISTNGKNQSVEEFQVVRLPIYATLNEKC